MSGEMGRRHQCDVQKLRKSRLFVLFDGLLRTVGVKAAVHVNQNT